MTVNGFTDILRQKNPSVKTILSIGGDGSKDAFSLMANQPSTKKTFINSAIAKSLSYGFSSIDIDWKYPQNIDEMNNYATLHSKLRLRVDENELLLTAAVYNSPTINWLAATYPMGSIASNLDWVNLMAYDYYSSSWEPNDTTGVNSDLYGSIGIIDTNYRIDEWIENGLPNTKIVLGMPFYGRAWKLANPSTNFSIGAATNELPSEEVAYANGINHDTCEISYRNIKNFIENNQATIVYDENYVTNYCYTVDTWISYDGLQSIDAKISYSNTKGLLEYFAWVVSSDDADFTLSNQFTQ